MLTNNTKKYIIKPTIIVLSLFFIFGVYKHVSSLFISDKDLIQTIWKELKLPEHSEVEIIYSSDHGFQGDGNRIYRINNYIDIKNSSLDCIDCNENFDANSKDIVQFVFSKTESNIGHINIKNFYEELKFIKKIEDDENTLVITYSEAYNAFYLFESLT